MTLQETNTLEAFQWTPQPEAERLVQDLVAEFLRRSAFGRILRERMEAEAGVRFQDMVDHITVVDSGELRRRLAEAGYQMRGTQEDRDTGNSLHFAQEHGLFPVIQPVDKDDPEDLRGDAQVSIRVESVADFVSVWQTFTEFFSCPSPLAQLRLARVDRAPGASLWVVERHGCRGIDYRLRKPVAAAECVLRHSESFRVRRRRLSDVEGFRLAEAVINRAAADLGVDYACDLFFAAERDYWQRRNRAAQIQKARQDRLGIGWANHDHHTYRSSRRHFARLISIFEKLGFHCRERFYAGKQAGWGAQVLEQPKAGIVIFADVDLSPDELLIDFAHEPLAERGALGTVGLWCALHGESFLQAGMHHLECQFDFDALRDQLEASAGVRMMKPFTDFPYLRQAFTEGERWAVDPERTDRLLRDGLITAQQAERFRSEGAIGSHLENLERNQGFKGFNQTGVSEIVAATDPRKHLNG